MCFINGDIDMCLTIDKDAGSEKYIVNKLSRLLTNSMFPAFNYFTNYAIEGMQSVKALPHARVPIVKFKDPKSRFLCDVSKHLGFYLIIDGPRYVLTMRSRSKIRDWLLITLKLIPVCVRSLI